MKITKSKMKPCRHHIKYKFKSLLMDGCYACMHMDNLDKKASKEEAERLEEDYRKGKIKTK